MAKCFQISNFPPSSTLATTAQFFEMHQNCLISIFSTFEFENSRQIIPILIWIFGGKIPIFELIRCLFIIFQLFVYILKKISCLFTFQGIMSAVCFNLRNIVSCLFIIKNETYLVIFAHCELSYSMLHFCQIAILLHISILKNVFSPFSHPNSSWTRMPANR